MHKQETRQWCSQRVEVGVNHGAQLGLDGLNALPYLGDPMDGHVGFERHAELLHGLYAFAISNTLPRFVRDVPQETAKSQRNSSPLAVLPIEPMRLLKEVRGTKKRQRRTSH
jgi:hypothetical protein